MDILHEFFINFRWCRVSIEFLFGKEKADSDGIYVG